MPGIDDIHQSYGDNIERIRGQRRTYSDEAYHVHLARTYIRHRDQAGKLRDADLQDAQNADAENRAKWTKPPMTGRSEGTGWDLIARRDATRFANEITDGVKLTTEYDQAERNQDAEMMRALAMRASELGALLGGTGAQQVMDRYAAANPHAQQARDGLRRSQTSNPAALLGHASKYAITPPTELAGLDDAKIERLARTDLDG